MARLVYLPGICPESWQLWTVAGEGSCLRDYRFSPINEDRLHSTEEIELMLEVAGNLWETAPHITYKNSEFWREQISFNNEGLGLEPIGELMEGDGGHRLQSLFADRITGLLTEYQPDELEAFIAEWIRGFSQVVERDQFNHFDNSDVNDRRDIEDGSHWTSTILECCRSGGDLSFISTGDEGVDFALFAAEVCFSLSSNSNPFQEGRRNSIQPDGLGLRRDQSIVVFEMKGPQDDHDPFTAMLQALCGALAATAKKEWIVDTAQSEGTRRPSIDVSGTSGGASCINLYIVIVPQVGETVLIQGDERLESSIPRIKLAFPHLGDVVFFVPARPCFNDITNLPATLVFR